MDDCTLKDLQRQVARQQQLRAMVEELRRQLQELSEAEKRLRTILEQEEGDVDRLEGGCTVSCHNDHRIAMSLAVAATCCRRPVTITGAQAVNKSYPAFWEDLSSTGARVETQVED